MKRRSFILFIFAALLWGETPVAANPKPRVEDGTLVIDRAGRRIDAATPFKRIISLYGAHTENLFSLQLGNEIIGVSRNESHPPEALTKPVFSYHDDLEKFLAAAPDLVLIRPMIDRGYAQLMNRLEKSGITVASLQPGTINDMYRYWRILGVLAGRPAIAQRMIDAFQSQVASMRAVSASIHPKKRVYFEAIHKRMKTFTPNAMAIFALETAGGINVAHDARSVRGTNIAFYGKEKILSLADSIDVFITQKGSMNQPTVDMIKQEPGFSLIKAVQSNEIYIVDEQIVSRPTLRLIQGIKTIAEILYPDQFKGETH